MRTLTCFVFMVWAYAGLQAQERLRVVGERGININDTLPLPALSSLSPIEREGELVRRRVSAVIQKSDRLVSENQPYQALGILLNVYDEEPLLKRGRFEQVYLNRRIAERLQELGAYHQALRFQRRIYDGLWADYYKDSSQITLTTFSLGHLHALLGHVATAEQYYREAVAFTDGWNTVFNASAKNNLGILFYDTQRYDSSRVYFERALRDSTDYDNRPEYNADLIYAIYDNLGLLEQATQNYAKARQHYTRNLTQGALQREVHQRRYPQAQLRLAELALLEGKTAEAASRLASTRDLITNLGAPYATEYAHWAERLRFRLLLNTGLASAAEQQFDKLLAVQDTLASAQLRALDKAFGQLLDIRTQQAEQKRALEAKRAEQRQRATENERRIAVLLLVVVSLILVVIGGVFYLRNQNYRRARQVAAQRQRELELARDLADLKQHASALETSRLELELEYKERDLLRAAQFVANQDNLLDDMIAKLSNVKKHLQAPDADAAVRQLVLDLKGRKSTDHKTRQLTANMDTVSQAFYSRLAARFPELSEGDRQLCGLIRLGLDPGEQAVMRGISKEGIKKARYRLRKRMGLDATIDLDRFIRDL